MHKHIYLGVAVFLVSGALHAQLHIQSGATVTIQSNALLRAQAEVANSGTISNAGTLSVAGNVVSSGTTAYNGGTLLLNGTATQTISGTQAFKTTNLTLNNSQGYTLRKSVSVNSTATFTQGMVAASSRDEPLEFTATATATGVTDAAHVNGYVRRLGNGTFVYPVGDGKRYQPVETTLTGNTAITTRYHPGTTSTTAVTDPLLMVNKLEYWDLTPTTSTNPTGTVTIYYDDYNNKGIDGDFKTNLKVANDNGSAWESKGGNVDAAATPNSGKVTSNDITSWSPFTLGSINLNTPLPVVLIGGSFTGKLVNNTIELAWKTGVESATSGFAVERSANGLDFETIGNIASKGSNSTYLFTDKKPLPGNNYYRLAFLQIEGGVVAQRSHVINVDAGAAGSIKLYPNPAASTLNIEVEERGTAVIYNTAGAALQHLSLHKGKNTVNISTLPAGVYILKTKTDSMKFQVKK